MPERLKGHDWKSCVRLKRTEGSNPSLSARNDTNRIGFSPFDKDVLPE